MFNYRILAQRKNSHCLPRVQIWQLNFLEGLLLAEVVFPTRHGDMATGSALEAWRLGLGPGWATPRELDGLGSAGVRGERTGSGVVGPVVAEGLATGTVMREGDRGLEEQGALGAVKGFTVAEAAEEVAAGILDTAKLSLYLTA